MAECRCGICEHCAAEPVARVGDLVTGDLLAKVPTPNGTIVVPGVTPEPEWSPPPDEPLRGVKPRRLLTRSRIAQLRENWVSELPSFAEVLDAYETAVHLLEEVVRESEPHSIRKPPFVTASDVAWLKLREAER